MTSIDRKQVGIFEDSSSWVDIYEDILLEYEHGIVGIAKNMAQADVLIERILSDTSIKVDAVLVDGMIDHMGDGERIASRLKAGGFEGTIISVYGSPQAWADYEASKGSKEMDTLGEYIDNLEG